MPTACELVTLHALGKDTTRVPVCETKFQGELSTSFWGGYSERHRAAAIGEIFFLGYFVSISFPIEFDVWGRLCTHFEAAKVMTFPPITQHFSVSLPPCHSNQNIFFFGTKNFFSERKILSSRIVEERIQISHSTQGSRSRSQ
jgi:hypothetical protein